MKVIHRQMTLLHQFGFPTSCSFMCLSKNLFALHLLYHTCGSNNWWRTENWIRTTNIVPTATHFLHCFYFSSDTHILFIMPYLGLVLEATINCNILWPIFFWSNHRLPWFSDNSCFNPFQIRLIFSCGWRVLAYYSKNIRSKSIRHTLKIYTGTFQVCGLTSGKHLGSSCSTVQQGKRERLNHEILICLQDTYHGPGHYFSLLF